MQGAPGYPFVVAPPRRRSGRTALLVVVGVIAACCAGGAVLALLASAALKNATSSVREAQPGLNAAVRDGKFEFVVTSFSCGHGSVGRFVTKKPQGQYCVAGVTVRNFSREAQTFADGYQKALSPDGAKFGADTAAGVVANENGDAVFNVINPGNQVDAKIVYDIPTDRQIVRLELHDSALSNGVTVTVG